MVIPKSSIIPINDKVVPVRIQVSKFLSLARWSLGSGPSTKVCTETSKYLKKLEHFSSLHSPNRSGAWSSSAISFTKRKREKNKMFCVWNNNVKSGDLILTWSNLVSIDNWNGVSKGTTIIQSQATRYRVLVLIGNTSTSLFVNSDICAGSPTLDQTQPLIMCILNPVSSTDTVILSKANAYFLSFTYHFMTKRTTITIGRKSVPSASFLSIGFLSFHPQSL